MTQPKTGQSSGRLLEAGAMAIVAAALFAAMSMSVKALEQLDAAELPVLEVTFFRYVFGLLTASPLMIAQGPSVFHTRAVGAHATRVLAGIGGVRSEEHTSELQSHSDLVCRLLLEKKKKKTH